MNRWKSFILSGRMRLFGSCIFILYIWLCVGFFPHHVDVFVVVVISMLSHFLDVVLPDLFSFLVSRTIFLPRIFSLLLSSIIIEWGGKTGDGKKFSFNVKGL